MVRMVRQDRTRNKRFKRWYDKHGRKGICTRCSEKATHASWCYKHWARAQGLNYIKRKDATWSIEEFVEWALNNPPSKEVYRDCAGGNPVLNRIDKNREWSLDNIEWKSNKWTGEIKYKYRAQGNKRCPVCKVVKKTYQFNEYICKKCNSEVVKYWYRVRGKGISNYLKIWRVPIEKDGVAKLVPLYVVKDGRVVRDQKEALNYEKVLFVNEEKDWLGLQNVDSKVLIVTKEYWDNAVSCMIKQARAFDKSREIVNLDYL